MYPTISDFLGGCMVGHLLLFTWSFTSVTPSKHHIPSHFPSLEKNHKFVVSCKVVKLQPEKINFGLKYLLQIKLSEASVYNKKFVLLMTSR